MVKVASAHTDGFRLRRAKVMKQRTSACLFFAHLAPLCAKISKKAEAIASGLRKNSYLCTRNHKTKQYERETETG